MWVGEQVFVALWFLQCCRFSSGGKSGFSLLTYGDIRVITGAY